MDIDDQVCPRCKTTKYRNPSLKLMVNVCGHALCESCVDLLFLKGSGSCPECGIALRRSNYRVQLFEDATVEKEVDIRKRVLRDYNKKEEDFNTLRDYNDYLEEIETIVFNLTNNRNIIETNKLIEAYKKENKDYILKNKVKIGREEYALEEIIEEEKAMEEARKKMQIQEEIEEKQKKIRAKEALIDELMFSSGNATQILQTYTDTMQTAKTEVKVAKPVQFSSGIKFNRRQEFMPVPKLDEGEPFIYTPKAINLDGPAVPDWVRIEKDGYLQNVKTENTQEKAGGYRSNIACMRALQEAFAGLYGSF